MATLEDGVSLHAGVAMDCPVKPGNDGRWIGKGRAS